MKRFAVILILSLLVLPIFFVNAAVKIYVVPKPIRILLVPGHDNKVWGAKMGALKEADMNLALATNIYNILKSDPRFEVWITRDQSGYTKEFADYFSLYKADILAYEQKAKKSMKAEIASGSVIAKAGAPHRSVSEDIALRIYGFDKWANENNMDATIHVHFNDYPHPGTKIGKYTGFTVYYPEGQLANSKISSALGQDIMTQLLTKYTKSTFKPESAGLVPDQKLIALGANGTLIPTVRSVLIEYGYIYQKILRTPVLRKQAYATMADLTATGIKNYFFNN